MTVKVNTSDINISDAWGNFFWQIQKSTEKDGNEHRPLFNEHRQSYIINVLEKVLNEQHNASLREPNDEHQYHIWFETEADLTWFILKYA